MNPQVPARSKQEQLYWRGTSIAFHYVGPETPDLFRYLASYFEFKAKALEDTAPAAAGGETP